MVAIKQDILSNHAKWIIAILLLTGCASNDDLRADYGPLFCPVDTVIVEKQVPVENQLTAFRFNKDKLDWRQSIYFAVGQYRVKASDEQQVSVNIATLQRYPTFNLLIKGFTDSSGSIDFNAALSLKRVLSVGHLLLEKGISAERIYIAAEGEMAPLNDDLTASDRAVNRRVDMVLLGPNGTDGYITLADHQKKVTQMLK